MRAWLDNWLSGPVNLLNVRHGRLPLPPAAQRRCLSSASHWLPAANSRSIFASARISRSASSASLYRSRAVAIRSFSALLDATGLLPAHDTDVPESLALQPRGLLAHGVVDAAH